MSALTDHLLASLSDTTARALFPSIRRDRMLDTLGNYLKGTGADALGANAPAPESLEPVQGGHNTALWRWRNASGDTFYIRVWRYDRRGRPARSHALAAQLLARAGLDVPRVILLDDSWRLLREHRIELLVESQAEGIPAIELIKTSKSDTPESLIEAVAGQFGRLHRLTSAAWGRPWRPENDMADPRRYWAGRVEAIRSRVTGHTAELSPDETDRGLNRLAASLESVPLDQPTLVHGDCSPAHVFLSIPNGNMRAAGTPWGMTWIDFGTVHYGHPAEDLSIFNHWPGVEGRVERWRQAYERELGRPLGAELGPALEAFEQLRLWEKLATNVRKAQRYGDRPRRLEAACRAQRKVERRIRRRGFVG